MVTINWPAWPQYGEEERDAVERVVTSNQLFADREVRHFEDQFAEYVGVEYAVGLGNATEGLHLALAALDVGAGDEVIVTPYSWISSASCVLMQNAIPIFCDIESESLGLCPADVEKRITDRTKAIIVVHMFGYPARVAEFAELSERYRIPLIEDASHAPGASIDNRMVGSFGRVSVFSLHQRKSISVGDGGVLCTNSPMIFDRVRRLRSFGHEELSYNYRMSEFAGALGQVGLSKLGAQNAVRSANAEYLAELLTDSADFTVRLGRSNEIPSFYAVLLDVDNPIPDLDSKLERIARAGVPIRKTWGLLHLHPHFNPSVVPARGLPWRADDYDGGMRNAEYRSVHLPVATLHCPDRVLELYVHPPAGPREMEFVARELNAIRG